MTEVLVVVIVVGMFLAWMVYSGKISFNGGGRDFYDSRRPPRRSGRSSGRSRRSEFDDFDEYDEYDEEDDFREDEDDFDDELDEIERNSARRRANVLANVKSLTKNPRRKNSSRAGRVADYTYQLRENIFSKAEENCFNILDEVFSKKFYVVPKMEIKQILDWEIKGQDWDAAEMGLGDKKVDFMLIHKKSLAPICAVEMGDRMLRDEETEEEIRQTEMILADVGFPLVRVTEPEKMEKREIVEAFEKALEPFYDN